MTPTAKLRFVEKDIMVPHERYANVSYVKTVKILQQWWAVERDGQITPTGEWRDVPLEKL